MTVRRPFHVRLVDDEVAPGGAQQAISLPAEDLVDDHTARDEWRAVVVAHEVRTVVEPIAEHRLVPLDVALDGTGVRVEQQLVRVGSEASCGVERAS